MRRPAKISAPPANHRRAGEASIEPTGFENSETSSAQASPTDSEATGDHCAEGFDASKPKIATLPYVDPAWIEDLAKRNPVHAVFKCSKAVQAFEAGTQRIRRLFISASYLSAFEIKSDPRKVKQLAEFRADFGLDKDADVHRVRERLIYEVFDAAFWHLSAERRYNYAHGLDHYLARDADPAEVKEIILNRGPEKLYREALERNKLGKALTAYKSSGRDLSAPIDEAYILAGELRSPNPPLSLSEAIDEALANLVMVEDDAGEKVSSEFTAQIAPSCHESAREDDTPEHADLCAVHTRLTELSDLAFDLTEGLSSIVEESPPRNSSVSALLPTAKELFAGLDALKRRVGALRT